MEISNFKHIAEDCKDMTFRQIWDIYDSQFQELKDAILSLGDKIVVETFTGNEVSSIVHTEHAFTHNHALVFKNSVLQLNGTDYEIIDSKTIRFFGGNLYERDVVTVIIFLTTMLVNENEMNKEHIRELMDEYFLTTFDERFRRIVDDEVESYLKIRGFVD